MTRAGVVAHRCRAAVAARARWRSRSRGGADGLELEEPPSLAAEVADGQAAAGRRAPAAQAPLVVDVRCDGLADRAATAASCDMLDRRAQGHAGMMAVYGYARLVGYDEQLDTRARHPRERRRSRTTASSPSICARATSGRTASRSPPRISATTGRTSPTTRSCRPPGRRTFLLVDGKPPKFEVLDETDGALQLGRAQPAVPARARRAGPLYIYRPAHYLKQFHAKYAEPRRSTTLVKAAGQRNWAALHNKRTSMYQNDNPDLPTLEPWVLTTPPPSSRFVFVRNPYFHRVDRTGTSCPTSTAWSSRSPTAS